MVENLTKNEKTFQKLVSENPLNIEALTRLGKKLGVTIKANRSKSGINRVCLTDRLLAIYETANVKEIVKATRPKPLATLQTVNRDAAKKLSAVINQDGTPKKKIGNQNVQIVIHITLQELANLLKSA